MQSTSATRIFFEPVITPIFQTWWRLRRSMTLGVRGLALDEHGRVLLVRHTYTQGWHFPGGGVEHGETALDAIVREMAEEGGLVAAQAPLLLGFYANHASFPNDHIALYRFNDWRTCAPASHGEIAERGFFAWDAPPDEATPGTRRRLAEIFQGAQISPTW